MNRDQGFAEDGRGLLLTTWMISSGEDEAVCEDNFSHNEAHAVCRDMGWSHANAWSFNLKSHWLNYNKSVKVVCTAPYWISCYSARIDSCERYVDLTCGSTERGSGMEGGYF